jgi:DNA/RNA-binding domain of Phe-tRNA-synthetase-like protein
MIETLTISINNEVLEKVPDLFVKTKVVRNVSVGKSPQELQERKNQLLEKWKGKSESDLESIPEIIGYRHLQEKLGSDPKKILPAVEGMLLRGILKGRFPTVNSAVDAANFTSVENLIPIGLFDLDRIEGGVELRLARQGDEFIPLGKDSPEKLKPNTPILKDSKKIFSAVGVRDSKDTMVTPASRNLLLFSWGTSEVDEEKVVEVLRKCASLIQSSK